MTQPRRPWLLLFNCQAMGLANCMNLLSRRIDVEHYDPVGFAEHRVDVLSRLEGYDRVIAMPGVAGADLDGRENVWQIPGVYFNGYHPDACFLSAQGADLMGPLRNCHSMIAFAAFQCGLGKQEAIRLYREEIYERMGYLEHWGSARAALIARYGAYGLDIERELIQWCRRGPFMHISVHPRITCLHGLARLIIASAGLEINDTGAMPHDNLANGPIFPVYPEIGSALAISGNYLFKRAGEYSCIGLEQFVDECFDAYASTAHIMPFAEFEPVLARAISVIQAEA